MPYDIIGDIHGHAAKLESLLKTLGYTQINGAYRHPTNQAIFVGDFIDRGPEQLRSVNLARRMVDSGSALAVMGNHEFNAIAWHTPDPNKPGEYLRPHAIPTWGAINRKQHAAFLAEVESNPALHTEIIDWFLTLPLWLDLPGLRIVHACWHQPSIDRLTPRLTRELMLDAGHRDAPDTTIYRAVATITKGIEIPLPDGQTLTDPDGHEWKQVRVRWWDEQATTYRSAAMLPKEAAEQLPEIPLPAHARVTLPRNKPTFFGHYWLTGQPTLESPHAACVDYSAGKGGPLVAYRYDGEPQLSPANFVSVP